MLVLHVKLFVRFFVRLSKYFSKMNCCIAIFLECMLNLYCQDLVFGDDDPEGDSHHYEPEDEELEHPQSTEIQQVVSFYLILC